MFVRRDPDEIGMWFLAFHTDPAPMWWLRLLTGRFTHVSAFAYSGPSKTWLFIDPNMASTRVVLVPEGPDVDRIMAEWIAAAAVLKIKAFPRVKFKPRLIFSCVSVIRHMLGLPGSFGALSVDALWRDCLANGAEIVTHEHSLPGS